jgi:hypothetical protein
LTPASRSGDGFKEFGRSVDGNEMRSIFKIVTILSTMLTFGMVKDLTGIGWLAGLAGAIVMFGMALLWRRGLGPGKPKSPIGCQHAIVTNNGICVACSNRVVGGIPQVTPD